MRRLPRTRQRDLPSAFGRVVAWACPSPVADASGSDGNRSRIELAHDANVCGHELVFLVSLLAPPIIGWVVTSVNRGPRFDAGAVQSDALNFRCCASQVSSSTASRLVLCRTAAAPDP